MQSQSLILSTQPSSIENKSTSELFFILPIIAFCVDLLFPFLIWKGIIPSSFRWASHALVVLMILASFARMLVFNHIPRVFLLIVAVSAIWGSVAVLRGQGVVSTIWGWWLLFQFPFIGIFLYLHPIRIAQFSNLFWKFAIAILGFEVAVQCVQYFLGQTPGDNLAGTFGYHGTGNLIIFIFFVNCLSLGHWITSKRWEGIVIALGLSLISSVLGEMKFLTIGIIAIFGVALVIYSIKNRTIFKPVLYGVLVVSALFAFVFLYNRIVPGAKKIPLESYFNNPQLLKNYLTEDTRKYVDGQYYTVLSRNSSLDLGWRSLHDDPVTMLFGWGLGARSESISLGTSGIGYQFDDLGLSTSTGLLVKMQELGLVGLVTLGGFFLWVIIRLLKDIRQHPSLETAGMRFAVVLFTCFWPLWLWYNNAWNLRVPMILYWGSLGVVMSLNNLKTQKSSGD